MNHIRIPLRSRAMGRIRFMSIREAHQNMPVSLQTPAAVWRVMKWRHVISLHLTLIPMIPRMCICIRERRLIYAHTAMRPGAATVVDIYGPRKAMKYRRIIPIIRSSRIPQGPLFRSTVSPQRMKVFTTQNAHVITLTAEKSSAEISMCMLKRATGIASLRA